MLALRTNHNVRKFAFRGIRYTSTTTAAVGTMVTVNAYYIARRIDLVKAHSGVYSTLKKSRLEQKSVTIEIDKIQINMYRFLVLGL